MDGEHGSRVLWGAAMVAVGGWWLLDSLGYVTFEWSYVGPIAVIAAGLSMLLGRGWAGCWPDEGRTSSADGGDERAR